MALALVTGGTGFVGSHVVRELLAQGHQVRVLHRSTSKLDALAGLPYESATGDLLDGESLAAAIAGCDWVFHVAAVADYWRADAARLIEANVEGTRQMLAAARDQGVRRFVFTSSAAAIGPRHDGLPASEIDGFKLKPDEFPYASSKHLAEGVVAEAVASGLDAVTVNPVIVLGPGDLNQISGSMVTQVAKLGPLVPVTSGGAGITDVRDVARWHVRAAEQGRTGERYILGTSNLKHADLFALIAETVGVRRPVLRVPDLFIAPAAAAITTARRLGLPTTVDAAQTRLGARDIYFRYEKTWAELGEPQVSIEQSIRDTFIWYRERGLA